MASDRRNRGALLRAQAALSLLEEVVVGRASVTSASSLQSTPATPATPPPLPPGPAPRHVASSGGLRRRFPLALAVGLGGLMLGASVLVFMGVDPGGGEPRRVDLEDGSVVTLQDGADIHAELGEDMRSIELHAGQARFDVAPDPARPFVVRAGAISAQATGTVYSVVRVGETGATVSVEEGGVLVWAAGGREHAVLLRAGGRLTLEPGSLGDAQVPAAGPAMLSLDNQTIDAAARRFNHLNSTRIVIDDPQVGTTRIVGLFKAADPRAFARAAAAVAGGCAVERGQDIVIESGPCPAATRGH